MGEPFLLVVNLSNCHGFLSDDKVFTMFVDTNKITIVHEFKIWVQWVYSLKYCIQLKFKNSVIHDMEDVTVLFRMKFVDVHPCPQICFHKQESSWSILKNLNLFTNWYGNLVPTPFVEKLQLITKKSSRLSTLAATMNDNEQSPSTSNFCGPDLGQGFIISEVKGYSKADIKVTKFENSASVNMPVDNEAVFKQQQPGNMIEVQVDCSEVDVVENKKKKIENPKWVQPFSTSETLVTLPAEAVREQSPLGVINLEATIKQQQPDNMNEMQVEISEVNVVENRKKKNEKPKWVRPFSIADTLVSLRAEAASQQSPQSITNLELDEPLFQAPCRKRKRVRKHKAKGPREAAAEASVAEARTPSRSFNFPKPNCRHIRFTNDVEEVDRSTEDEETFSTASSIFNPHQDIQQEAAVEDDVSDDKLKEFCEVSQAEVKNLIERRQGELLGDYGDDVTFGAPQENCLMEIMSLNQKHSSPVVFQRQIK